MHALLSVHLQQLSRHIPIRCQLAAFLLNESLWKKSRSAPTCLFDVGPLKFVKLRTKGQSQSIECLGKQTFWKVCSVAVIIEEASVELPSAQPTDFLELLLRLAENLWLFTALIDQEISNLRHFIHQRGVSFPRVLLTFVAAFSLHKVTLMGVCLLHEEGFCIWSHTRDGAIKLRLQFIVELSRHQTRSVLLRVRLF